LTARDFLPTTPEEERALVEGLSAGKVPAVDEFVRRTHGPVFRMTARYSQDLEHRQDWTHDVLLKVIQELRQRSFTLTQPGGFWAWFKKRAHFLLLDRAMKLRRDESKVAQGEHAEGLLESVASTRIYDDPSHAIEAWQARRIVERCLDRIVNADHRNALEAQMFEEQSYEAIATTLSAPINTVRSWIRRARISLRQCVASSMGTEIDSAD
jgi:RNA polymerase sigma-70 factor (ECF subfamily)